MKEMVINIFNTVGNAYCVDVEDGNRVYELIKKALDDKNYVKLNFQNVEVLTSAFLNTAVGQLYRDFDEQTVKKYLSVQNMLPEDQVLLKRVTSTAKFYYKNPDMMQESINEILEED